VTPDQGECGEIEWSAGCADVNEALRTLIRAAGKGRGLTKRRAPVAADVKPRNTAMPKQPPARPMVLGVAWFSPTQWQRLTEVVEDRNELDDTFEQWERGALDAVRTIERQGQRVEKVYLDVEALVSWCKARGLPVNGPSRAQYVSAVLQERDGNAEA